MARQHLAPLQAVREALRRSGGRLVWRTSDADYNDTMRTARHKPHKRPLPCLRPILVGMAPLLYVLGVGPAIWLHGHVPEPVGVALRTLYMPLEVLYKNSEAAREVLHPYYALWM